MITQGLVTAYLTLIVLLPLAAVVWQSTKGERRLLGRRHRPAGRGGAEADAGRLGPRRARQRRGRDADRVGARPRRVPRASRSSTR